MFLGEILALGFYFLHKAKNPESYALRAKQAQEEGKLLEFNRFKFAIPALCDVLASNLQLFALNFIAGSVYQMMRGGTIITTFIFSLIILKMKAKLFQIVGSALAFIGIAIVGVSAMVFSNPSDN
jgi:drug/metabolite transporter (DMT)-like permease